METKKTTEFKCFDTCYSGSNVFETAVKEKVPIRAYKRALTGEDIEAGFCEVWEVAK